jgi:hypothetical protein
MPWAISFSRLAASLSVWVALPVWNHSSWIGSARQLAMPSMAPLSWSSKCSITLAFLRSGFLRWPGEGTLCPEFSPKHPLHYTRSARARARTRGLVVVAVLGCCTDSQIRRFSVARPQYARRRARARTRWSHAHSPRCPSGVISRRHGTVRRVDDRVVDDTVGHRPGLAGPYSTPCTATMRSRAAPSRSVLACR